LPADERLHRRVYTSHPPRDLLYRNGKHIVPVNPPRVKRHCNVCAPPRVNGGDDLLADIHGLDDRGDECVGGLHAVEERRRQLARLDEDGADLRVRGCELGGQRLVQGRDAGLGGGVVRQGRGAQVAEDRGHGHDGAAVAAADHGREEGLKGVEVCREVRGDGLFNVLELEVQEGLALDDGGVVDQDGGGAEISFNLRRDPRDLRLVRDVALVERDAPRFPVLHVVDVQHGDGGAAHAVHLGDEKAQAAGAAGDDDDLLAEVDVTRQAVGDALVDHVGHPAQRDEGCPYDGGDHGRGIPA
ncbi:hypothetical protein CI238_10222, partial [Colletotrichum incanum]